jgi:hypothetical protein
VTVDSEFRQSHSNPKYIVRRRRFSLVAGCRRRVRPRRPALPQTPALCCSAALALPVKLHCFSPLVAAAARALLHPPRPARPCAPCVVASEAGYCYCYCFLTTHAKLLLHLLARRISRLVQCSDKILWSLN